MKTDKLAAKITALTAALLISTPASAQANNSSSTLDTVNLGCKPPDGIDPLFQLLDSLIMLGQIGGAMLGVLGLVIAGLAYILPGDDLTQRGKQIAKGTIIGVIILFSAQMVMAFLTSQLGGVICG